MQYHRERNMVPSLIQQSFFLEKKTTVPRQEYFSASPAENQFLIFLLEENYNLCNNMFDLKGLGNVSKPVSYSSLLFRKIKKREVSAICRAFLRQRRRI